MPQAGQTPHIEVFLVPSDPDGRDLTDWLDAQGLAYVQRDLSEAATSREAVARTGLRIAPLTLVDGRVIWGTAAEQQRRLQSILWRNLQS